MENLLVLEENYNHIFNLEIKIELTELNGLVYHILDITTQDRFEKKLNLIVCTNEIFHLLKINLKN